jgi:HD superfamily phosphohydrolase
MTVKTFEIRCPIYGFISLDPWEREIIAQPAFQRLRRVRQLGWTDAVYPGAMHTRFEHSLGVMHMASLLYNGVQERCGDILKTEYQYDESGVRRYHRLIRLAALLHDVGHGPFSHAVEELAPFIGGGEGSRRYRHEEYSTAIIRRHFREVIENHPANANYRFTVDDVCGLIEGKAAAGSAAIWQELISSQLDADRMDYLLRDSFHSGVEYGRYDWRRLVNSVELVRDSESASWRLGVSDGGRHVAEGFIIARYMMFSQIYFHKARVILDYHLHHAVEELLPNGVFPAPVGDALDEYLQWDDWRVLGQFAQGLGGDHAYRLKHRDFFRLVYETPEIPSVADEQRLANAVSALEGLLPVRREARKSWYKVGSDDLPVASSNVGGQTMLLSEYSSIVRQMAPSRSVRLYVSRENRAAAQQRLDSLFSQGRPA